MTINPNFPPAYRALVALIMEQDGVTEDRALGIAHDEVDETDEHDAVLDRLAKIPAVDLAARIEVLEFTVWTRVEDTFSVWFSIKGLAPRPKIYANFTVTPAEVKALRASVDPKVSPLLLKFLAEALIAAPRDFGLGFGFGL